MKERYEYFRHRHLVHHENAITSSLSTVGDVVMVGGGVAGLVSRRPRIAGLALIVGFGVAAIAHVFQPGTLREELAAIFLHPARATKAEYERIFRPAG